MRQLRLSNRLSAGQEDGDAEREPHAFIMTFQHLVDYTLPGNYTQTVPGLSPPSRLPARGLIQITGATPFQADVEVDTDDLNPNTPPLHPTGTFTLFHGHEKI